jgi:hypothetical protein
MVSRSNDELLKVCSEIEHFLTSYCTESKITDPWNRIVDKMFRGEGGECEWLGEARWV